MRQKAILVLVLTLLAVLWASAAKAVDVSPTLDTIREATQPTVRDWKFLLGGDPGGERVDLDDSAWETVSPRHSWMKDNGRAWYRKAFVVPETIAGRPIAGQKLILRLGTDDDCDIFINGQKVKSLHWEGEVTITDKANPGDKLLIAVLVKNIGGPGELFNARLYSEAMSKLVKDTESYSAELNRSNQIAGADKTVEKTLTALVEKSIARLDMGSLKSGDAGRFDASLAKARAELVPVQKVLRKYELDLVGNAHIDMAWLWRWPETVDVCKNTFGSVLKLMKEFPDFTYVQSQAQAYLWMEERYPDIFKQIQERVKEGRWEIVGGMWVEPDCNMPNGESFVRQLLYGKRYFQQKFGVDVKVGWNPDTFGYAWTLPQIYKKAGVDYFVTQKISWNDTTRFPYKLFWWESPDGSRVLTFFPDGYNGNIDNGMMERPLNFKRDAGVNKVMALYGVGDHGGGPTREMLKNEVEFKQKAGTPTIHDARALEFLDSLKSTGVSYPVWKDELYLETHRGVTTSQAAVKRGNRKSEILLGEAELYGSLATLYGSPYDPWQYENAWRKVMFNQFHDVLPGSGIAPVYKDTLNDYAKVKTIGEKLMNGSLGTLDAQINTLGAGRAVVVHNSLSWERTDIAKVILPDGIGHVEVFYGDGKPIVSQLVEDDETGKPALIFLAEKVPAVGYKLYRIEERADISGMLKAYNPLSTEGSRLENEYLRATIDPVTGCVSSLFDKVNNREAFDATGRGNLLQTFKDAPSNYGAWNIDRNFEDVMWNLDKADSVQVVERGPVRATIRVTKHFQKSTFIQDLTIYTGVPRLDCRMKVAWNEKLILLKAAFPMAEKSDVATFDIPYGSIERSTLRETPAQQAKFEVAGQKWADISGKDYGVSILNESKYGWDAKGNVLRLSLLRSPTNPDPHADEGDHAFAYAIYPHKGDWREGGTVREGYEFNVPLIARLEAPHAGALSALHSFLSVGPENVALGALKRAEDDSRWIVRIYEYNGRKGEATITLPKAPKRVHEADLMEKNGAAVKTQGNTITVPIGANEIKTLAIEF